MKQFRTKLKQTQNREIRLKDAFRSENGAIDLASIMVGIIVIGLIGGVIAATVFAIIPWSQDNAAKQQLDSVVAAESAYMGLSSTNPPSLPAGLAGNSYGNSTELETAGLLKAGPRYCASTMNTGPASYEAFAQSSSGNIWSATDKVTKPVIFTGTLPTDCQFITEGVTATVPTPTATETPAPPADPILIKKWNFESGLDGWSAGTINTTETIVTADATHGKVARISGQVQSTAIYASHYSYLTVGKKYKLVVELSARQNVKTFDLAAAGGRSNDTSDTVLNAWKTYTVEFTASGQSRTNLQTTARSIVTNSTITYYIDNAELWEIP